MISLKLVLFLMLGTIAMLIPIVIQGRWKGINIYKCIIIAISLTIVGTIGTYIMYYVENRDWGGRSFFGAVFFIPVAFFVFSKIIKVPYGKLLDLSAPAECIMLAIMKMQCVVDGCCGGRELISGTGIFFPSQIVELLNAIWILFLLMFLAKQNKNEGKIYPFYLLLYGGSRFFLDFMRVYNPPFMLGISAGSFWAMIAAIVGYLVLYLNRKQGDNFSRGDSNV